MSELTRLLNAALDLSRARDDAQGSLFGDLMEPEKYVFAYGRSVLGQNAGGQVAKLIRVAGLGGALDIFIQARTKGDPKSWVAAQIQARETRGKGEQRTVFR